MLVLTRKAGERICIGDDIVVEVIETVGRNTVRLGVSAPDDISVDREEIRKRREKEYEDEQDDS